MEKSMAFLGIYSEKTIITKDTCNPMFTEALFTIAMTMEETYKSIDRGMDKNTWGMCMCVCMYVHMCVVCVYICSVATVLSDSWQHYGLQPTRLLCPLDSPGKNTGVGCHALLLQGIFPTQGLNLHLLHGK